MKKKKLLKLINKSVVCLENRNLELAQNILLNRKAINGLHDHVSVALAEIFEAAALEKQYEAENVRLKAAISWALGEGDSDFGDNMPKSAGSFWWRKELRQRAE